MESNFLRGSVAGLITCSLVQPLDVIKTNILTLKHSSTITESFVFINSRHGIKGFWRGLRPGGYKAFIGSGISFYYLEFFKSLVSISNTGFMSNSLVAIVSRGLTIITLCPLSIIKLRMEAPQATPYKSVGDGLIRIYKEEGVKGYYKGLSSNLLRDLPFAGLSYGFYEFFSGVIANFMANPTPTLYNKIFSGALAGFTATILTQPFDVIKARQQFHYISDTASHEYKGLIDAMHKIYINEGIKGYTTGLRIRLIERSLGFTLVWFIYEYLKSHKNSNS
jgi:Mitochondrial carrier protein